MVVGKKQCARCKRMKSRSEFYKDKKHSDGLYSWCKKCVSEYQKELCIFVKREVMMAFGGRCVHIVKNGVQCLKSIKNDLKELELSHPNGDGDEHRNLISNGRKGTSFYSALKKRNWNTDGFVVEIRCKSHHNSLDHSGKKHYNYGRRGKLNILYKEGKFNDSDWLKKKYDIMSLREIADECGVSQMLILRRMKEFNIPRRGCWPRKII